MNDIDTVLKSYFKDCEIRKRLSELTLKAYKIDLNQYLKQIESDIENNKKIGDYIYYLNQLYVKPKTIKRKVASVKAFYAYMEYEGIIENSPFNKIRTNFKEPQLLPKVIDSKSIQRILQYLDSCISNSATRFEKKLATRNAAIVEVLFATGIRISELCNIKTIDLDLNENILKIYGKGSKERILYIGNSNVTNILIKYIDLFSNEIHETGYVFISKSGDKLSEQSVRILLGKIETKLELSMHITPHMFRHTFATMLLEKDVDIRYIQKILGHSSISITQIYTHVSNTKQKEILSNKNPRNDYEDMY